MACSSDWPWVAEMASEELEKLEAAHPGRFGPLKAELRQLISHPRWDPPPFPPASPEPSAARSAATQASSNRKRNCGSGGGDARAPAAPAEKDRAEMAIARAERCLKRIRAVKQSLCGFTD